jgi:hypothetical protein
VVIWVVVSMTFEGAQVTSLCVCVCVSARAL